MSTVATIATDGLRNPDAAWSSSPPPRRAAPPPTEGRGEGTRVLRPRRAAPADALRPTRAEVNLANLRHNLRVLERALTADRDAQGMAGKPAKIWGVLKADAYGHGAPAVARTLERAGIAGLCVALLEEAVELREAGIRAPILVMGGYYGARRDGISAIVENDLVPVVSDAGQIEQLANFARLEAEAPITVHLKIDTGMGRLGASPRDLDAVLEALRRHPEVRLEGLMTHFACADADDLEPTREQLRLFEGATRRAAEAGIAPRIRHAANSAALFRLPEARLDVVRPGLALFGYDAPGLEGAHAAAGELRPVMRVRSEIVALRELRPGERIGYGHTFQAERPSLIATIPMGYADGLSRLLSNRGSALVRGRRAPVAGTISMDLTMLDVTDVPGARLGDEIVFLGTQEGPLGRGSIDANEIAALSGTIAWEVLTHISRRVPRFYREP